MRKYPIFNLFQSYKHIAYDHKNNNTLSGF